MKTIRSLNQLTLTFEQPNRFRPVYQLRSGAEVLGKMKLEGMLISVARVESGDGAWEFTCTRFIMPRISIRSADMVYVGSFEGRRDGSGILEFLDGRKLLWSCNGLWHDERWFTSQDGQPLIRFKPSPSRRFMGQVEINPEALSLDELTPLVFLGWYILYLIEGEESGFSVSPVSDRSWPVLESLIESCSHIPHFVNRSFTNP
jgi:hypothetical protein